MLARNYPLNKQGKSAITLALIYHDIIYDSKALAGENEQKSAELAQERLSDLNVDMFTIRLVYQSILATDHSRTAPAGGVVGDIVHDADLFSLAKAWSKFLSDGEKVRQEYPRLSDEEFVLGRKKFMQTLLRRPAIYRTTYAQSKWGKKARDNLHRLVNMA